MRISDWSSDVCSSDLVDWEQVQVLRQLAYMRLSAATEDREGIDEDTRRELARKIIVEIVGEQARELDLKGGGSLDIDDQQRLATAVFESVFGLRSEEHRLNSSH